MDFRPPVNVVFDIDDVFWPLNEKTCRASGIPYEKIVTYHYDRNPLLSASEKQALLEAYTDRRLHADMAFFPDAREFLRLALDPRVKPWLVSNGLSRESLDDKQRNMRAFLGKDYGRFEARYHLIVPADSHKKELPDDIYMIFDDSPSNVAGSKARYAFMPERPWNQSVYGISELEPVLPSVRFYSDIATAVDRALALLDRDIPLPHGN